MDAFTTFAHAIQDTHNITFSLSRSGQGIVLSSLIIPKKRQRSGLGTQVMHALCALADAQQVTLSLSPAQRDPHHGTTSRTRLVRFYKRFGFVENKGRHKDFSLSYAMWRAPRPG